MAYTTLRMAVAAGFILFSSAASYGAMAVYDPANLAEAQKQLIQLKEQIKTAQEQLKAVTKMRDDISSTLNAIGEATSLSIPSINFNELSSQIMGDMGCLVPDYQKMMPSLDFDNISLGSVCERGDAYRSGLMSSPDDVVELNWEEKRDRRKGIQANRSRVITDATTKGLAQADKAQEDAATTLRTAQEYKNAGSSATTMNDRLQVLIEVEVAQLASQAAANQMMAQLLKVMSAQVIHTSVPLENDMAKSQSEDDS
ncbi:hypothetical protein [Pseudovibrio sp. Tun.PSC04-5.I4]|uniref:hypothetical protein n=1 Tax=Pseudovibrio sp. Tun.PSC04-5.I4 TaxID=1798213 RepID=UPI0008811748|nr:hypothetical protein [Pseudovibrio sp. Tun.PSC04-5.I4]SDR49055.1 hypothetical protein SAMN04515695_6114 [Pseudovibrio sp. Tun.PSC04-5.I4]